MPKCKFVSRLLVKNENPDFEAIEIHIQGCKDCFEYMKNRQRIITALTSLKEEDLNISEQDIYTVIFTQELAKADATDDNEFAYGYKLVFVAILLAFVGIYIFYFQKAISSENVMNKSTVVAQNDAKSNQDKKSLPLHPLSDLEIAKFKQKLSKFNKLYYNNKCDPFENIDNSIKLVSYK